MGLVKQQWLEERSDRSSRDYHLRRNDQDRRSRHYLLMITMHTDEYEFRYERRGDVYLIKRWHNGIEWTDRGTTDNVPVWLAPILVVAKVSGHLRKTNEPPPDEILWFRTNRAHQLTTFIDLEDTR